MKLQLLLLSVTLFVCSCKQGAKETTLEKSEEATVVVTKEKEYPEGLDKVFVAHGGLGLWKQQRTLTFEIPKPENPETHTTDLWSRTDKIVSPSYTLGFDGKQPWVEGEYKGNAEFYHNLMFYFYAMPFILADDGIIYQDTDNLEFEGKSYPGIKIGYNSGVGTSPKDEYYLHYNPDTHIMEWLGYTVTYRTGEPSENVKWIRYDDWKTVDGLLLPNSISWYNYEGKHIKDKRNTVTFENISISNVPQPTSFYAKPDTAVYYVKPE